MNAYHEGGRESRQRLTKKQKTGGGRCGNLTFSSDRHKPTGLGSDECRDILGCRLSTHDAVMMTHTHYTTTNNNNNNKDRGGYTPPVLRNTGVLFVTLRYVRTVSEALPTDIRRLDYDLCGTTGITRWSSITHRGESEAVMVVGDDG
jgi:hypothetical protein